MSRKEKLSPLAGSLTSGILIMECQQIRNFQRRGRRRPANFHRISSYSLFEWRKIAQEIRSPSKRGQLRFEGQIGVGRANRSAIFGKFKKFTANHKSRVPSSSEARRIGRSSSPGASRWAI